MVSVSHPDPGAAEEVQGVLGRFALVSGFMGVKQRLFTLVVTDRRVIFAELTKERMKQLSLEAKAKAEFEGKGMVGRAAAQLHARDGVTATYWAMSPDEALRESSGNFAIDRADIEKVKFKTGAGDDPDQYAIIKTATGKYKLSGVSRAQRKQFSALALDR